MQTQAPKKKERVAFVTISRREIAPEAQDAISSILKNKIQEGLDPLLALTSRKATATSRIADMRMTKAEETATNETLNID
jgi:hypothetical protein